MDRPQGDCRQRLAMQLLHNHIAHSKAASLSKASSGLEMAMMDAAVSVLPNQYFHAPMRPPKRGRSGNAIDRNSNKVGLTAGTCL